MPKPPKNHVREQTEYESSSFNVENADISYSSDSSDASLCFTPRFIILNTEGTIVGDREVVLIEDLEIHAPALHKLVKTHMKKRGNRGLPRFPEISHSFHISRTTPSAIHLFAYCLRGKELSSLNLKDYALVDFAELWMLGHRYDAPAMQNRAMDVMDGMLRSRRQFRWVEFTRFLDVLIREKEHDYDDNNELWKFARCRFQDLGARDLVDEEPDFDEEVKEAILGIFNPGSDLRMWKRFRPAEKFYVSVDSDEE